MNADEAKNRMTHQIALHARESLEVQGVTDVVSFDEQAVILNTVCGNMTVEGASLHIRVLNVEQGVVAMDGRVDSISYEDTDIHAKGEKGGFFGKLFR